MLNIVHKGTTSNDTCYLIAEAYLVYQLIKNRQIDAVKIDTVNELSVHSKNSFLSFSVIWFSYLIF
jgi:hypothetical protein